MDELQISPLPPLVQMLLTAYIRKGLAIVGTALATQGILTDDNSALFYSEAPGLILIAISVGWTGVSAWLKRERAKAAVAVALETPVAKAKNVEIR